MPHQKVSDRQVHAFDRFLKLMPSGSDIELVVLKAHLLVEEQLRQVIDERVKTPTALKDARLECHQCICLVEAFFPEDVKPWLWKALKKLNNIRNAVAHSIEPKGLQDKLDDFVRSVRSRFPNIKNFPRIRNERDRLEFTLWSLFTTVSGLVEYPSAVVLELAPRDTK